MTIETLSSHACPAKRAGRIHLSSQLLVIVGIVVGICVLAIIGWREGGARASRTARDVERNREVDE